MTKNVNPVIVSGIIQVRTVLKHDGRGVRLLDHDLLAVHDVYALHGFFQADAL